MPVTAPAGLYGLEVMIPVAITNKTSPLIDKISLYPSYPNPFNNSTTIQLSLPFQADVSLEIYNSLGERMAILNEGLLQSGMHKFQWNADAAGSGIYFYILKTKGFTATRKILLIK